jgi:NADH dehydrogenase (ubiquinone) Fe-S protein 6
VSFLEKGLDAETHTGQQWSEEDVRSARWLHRNKQVNPNWAIDIMKKNPIIEVNTHVVACDGGGGALGHPREGGDGGQR